ncbi:hypothetical protein SA27298_0166 [Streptococcus anginosus]|nr:hypothetical protein SA27298_0166 [Streptococcus anginosus]
MEGLVVFEQAKRIVVEAKKVTPVNRYLFRFFILKVSFSILSIVIS